MCCVGTTTMRAIAALLVEGRYRLSVVAPSGTVFESGHAVGHGARHAMVEAMTDLAPSEETWLGRAVTDTEASTGDEDAGINYDSDDGPDPGPSAPPPALRVSPAR